MEHLDWEQIRELLRVARRHRPRDHAMLAVEFWHGLRASEVVGPSGLTRANFDFSANPPEITVRRLKGSHKTIHPLISHPDILFDEVAAVRSALAEIPPQMAYLFPLGRRQLHRLMVEYGAEAGIPRRLCKPHVLKHSIAVYMLRTLRLRLDTVQRWLGHKSIASTGEYLKMTDSEAAGEFLAALRSGPAQGSLF